MPSPHRVRAGTDRQLIFVSPYRRAARRLSLRSKYPRRGPASRRYTVRRTCPQCRAQAWAQDWATTMSDRSKPSSRRLARPCVERDARRRGRRPGVADARRHRGQAALYGGRSGRAGEPWTVCPAWFPFLARAQGDDVCRPALDHPPVCRLLDCGGLERLLPAKSGGRADGPVGRLRSGHPPRLRQRPSAGRRRCRQGRRGDRQRRGHEDPVRRHPGSTACPSR